MRKRTLPPDVVLLLKQVQKEFEERATRKGELAVMSTRFPARDLNSESIRYANAVMEFIDSDVEGQDVLEVGGGIGRLTCLLERRVGKLTCIEPVAEMLRRNKERLGERAGNVNYLEIFLQEYVVENKHQVAICSLVLAHNPRVLFSLAAQVLSQAADTIFLFEHTVNSAGCSSATTIRSESEILAAFGDHRLIRRELYKHFNDEISFLKLVREI